MRRVAALFGLALAAPLLIGAAPKGNAPKLVPDVSQRAVEIRSGFTGAELLLFGAIVYPRGAVPDADERIDIAVVLKGPVGGITVREKQKIAGIWINAHSSDFRSAPGYYAVATSRPIRDIVDERTAAIFELGLGNLQLSPTDTLDGPKLRRFEAGLVDLNQRHGLYREREGEVEITDQVLYRARLGIPASVPTGRYTAETFLIRDGRVLAAATRDVEIGKSGFERFVAMVADRYSFTYGLMAVLVSLGLGWFAGFVFRRAGG